MYQGQTMRLKKNLTAPACKGPLFPARGQVKKEGAPQPQRRCAPICYTAKTLSCRFLKSVKLYPVSFLNNLLK
ncbi:hypothetical protein SAMN05216311_102414 [Chitinophaga sp. CF418]|nr:hypothetical protein SAMN05216311_102414 [Chitinophaga sp. CF418]